MRNFFINAMLITLLPFFVNSQISIDNASFTYTQNFNTLAFVGTSSDMPAGWSFAESGAGANGVYSEGSGSSSTGDTYSYAIFILTFERALGGLRSGTFVTTFGAVFTNNTGQILNSITVGYYGEQWRLGATGRVDRLDFQLSSDATSLTTGTWSDVNQLDFTAPITTGSVGNLDGDASANRTLISHTIGGLSILPGDNLWFRWTDFDATGNDDGLAIDDFTIQSIVLPVTFANIAVRSQNNAHQISFSTASETNNDYFTIERSADARSFDAIGEIKGAGNSRREISYTYTDEKPLKGINYYRIKQTDYDGKFSYSEMRSLRFAGVGTISLTPRTTEGRLDVRTELEDYTLAVYNTAGQEVKRFPAMSLDQSISIDELMSGIYFVRVSSGSEVETIRVVKM